MIETDIVLHNEENEPIENGAIILVPDDPSLYKMGKAMEMKYQLKDSVVMVPKRELLHKLRSLTSEGKRAYGIMWRADLEEERPGEQAGDILRTGKINHNDENPLSGRPAPTLMGRSGQSGNTVPGRPRALTDREFPTISADLLRSMGRDYDLMKQPAEGSLGKIDPAVKMVHSGEIIDRIGFDPMQKIMDSEPAIIRIGK